MAGDTSIPLSGNLTADPELRFTSAGAAVANFTVASTPRAFNKASNEWEDGETLFLRCTVWREQAENAAESLRKGMGILLFGRLKQRSYEKDGDKRTVVEVEVDEIGPSLRRARAVVTKNNNAGSGSGGGSRADDPWASKGSSSRQGDAPPF